MDDTLNEWFKEMKILSHLFPSSIPSFDIEARTFSQFSHRKVKSESSVEGKQFY